MISMLYAAVPVKRRRLRALSLCLIYIWNVIFLCGFTPANQLSSLVAKNNRILQSSAVSSHLFTRVVDTDCFVEKSANSIDKRPHKQRAETPRPARRLNHSFKHLYRPDVDNTLPSDPLLFLQQEGDYSMEQVLNMNATFPPLLTLSVSRHLYPKLRFLKETLGVKTLDQMLQVPPQYFGARLECTIAPRHALLAYYNLPHGSALLDNNATKLRQFLLACRNSKTFAALCQVWQKDNLQHSTPTQPENLLPPRTKMNIITSKQVEAMDALFSRGLMAAARNEIVQHNNTWPLLYINISAADLSCLLIQHGANPLERDFCGVTLSHWAAGTGNLDSLKVLLPFEKHANMDVSLVRTMRDDATLLHWAAAGVGSREFGCGGHVEVCEYLLQHQSVSLSTRKFVNHCTYDGNSALMWASWSGTLDTVKLLIRHRANATVRNSRGCTVAHWAASGGNVEVCQYLAEVVGVDFTQPNYGGNTPLTHAVAFGRAEVVSWLKENALHNIQDESIALELAQQFVHWTDGDGKRKEVLAMFHEHFDSNNSPLSDKVTLCTDEL